MNIKTFETDMKQVKSNDKEAVAKADRGLFARLVVIAQTRQMDMRNALSHSLGPVPWSLALADGTLARTAKSKLLQLLEGSEEPAEHVSPSATWVFDGMAIIHALVHIPATFSELAEHIFDRVMLNLQEKYRRVDFVVERYPDVSIKNPERHRRSKGRKMEVKIHSGSQKDPRQWHKFLSAGSNKERLAEFLFSVWQSDKYAEKLVNRSLYMTHGKYCHKLTSHGHIVAEQVDELLCSHEEADSRILLHAKHASASTDQIVIRSRDTDVAVLACAFHGDIPANIPFYTGTKHRTRYINIDSISESIGGNVCQALLGMHAFTGCDSTSAFVGKGKKRAFELIKTESSMCRTMHDLGKEFTTNDALESKCEEFVCWLYGKHGKDVIDLRYRNFCSASSQTSQLPPTSDALRKHTMRANYQAAVWRRALVAQPDIQDPDGHGWKVSSGILEIDWMNKLPAPKVILELVACKCAKQHCSQGSKCSCQRNGLPCTDACDCSDCENGIAESIPHEDDEYSDEDDHDMAE